MTSLSFENVTKKWSLYPLDKPTDSIVTGKLLNENKSELLKDDKSYDEDWMAFSIAGNHSKIKPLEVRTTPLVPGEKLYVVGWTRKMESGAQRVYEFEFFKKVNNRLLLKEVIVPEKFGGLSGGPVVDEQGFVVGIVFGGTEDPGTGKKYFSPCGLDGLVSFLEKFQVH